MSLLIAGTNSGSPRAAFPTRASVAAVCDSCAGVPCLQPADRRYRPQMHPGNQCRLDLGTGRLVTPAGDDGARGPQQPGHEHGAKSGDS